MKILTIIFLFSINSFAQTKIVPLYYATITRIIDGDTMDAKIDLGFGLVLDGKLRIAKYDAPEIFSPKTKVEEELGQKAKKYTTTILLNKPVILRIRGKDKYGRILSDVEVNGKDFATDMIAKGFVK